MTDERIEKLTVALREFARERDWDQFHSPQNLAIALSVECGELLEHFQWLTAPQSESLAETRRDQIRLEIADVFLYLLRLADRLSIDIVAAAFEKMALNAEKYPVALSKGTAKKYTEF